MADEKNIKIKKEIEIEAPDEELEIPEREELEIPEREELEIPEREELEIPEKDEEAELEEASEEGGEEGGEEKKDFRKKQKADKKQDVMKEKIGELEDKVKRQMAEFDNFRKRTDKEKTAMFETGAKSVIEKILPVVDNFERGLATIPEEEKGTPFAEGMEMIYRQFMTELDKMEVKVIPAVGKKFDPALHNAVMQVESDEYESGVIAQELLKGYTYRDTVVRHSMVAVVA